MGHETQVGTAQIVIAGFILSAEAGAVDRYVHAAVRWIRGDEHCTHRSVEAAPDHSNDWMSRREINERARSFISRRDIQSLEWSGAASTERWVQCSSPR